MTENTGEVDNPRHKEARVENVEYSKNEKNKKELSKIVSSIKSKFKNNQPFSEIASHLAVVANPKQSLDLFSDAVSYKYILQTLKNDGHNKSGEELPPHLFATAGNALRRILDNNEDTCVVFMGDTESGKTESSRLFVRQLTRLSRATNQNSKKVTYRIHYVDTVFDAFGAYISRTQSSRSIVARYTEIQYNQSEIVGAKLITYLLNSQYITHRDPADRNVNVLHYILAGSTKEEVIHYRLDSAANSPYVRFGKGTKSLDEAYKSQIANDRIRFNELREHLKYLGFGRRSQSHIFRTLSLILHLGLLSFTDNNPDVADSNDSYYCTVKNVSELELVAELIGVDAHNLNRALVTQTRQSVNTDIYTKFLTAKEAEVSRDNFVETLYNFLFTYIIEKINKKICQENCLVFIGIVDFPGFEISELVPHRNSSHSSASRNLELYRLLKNYANENLVNFMCERISSWNDEYKNDGIRSVSPRFNFQNPYLLLALAGGKQSLLPLIEKHASDPHLRSNLDQGDVSQLNLLATNILGESLNSATVQARVILRQDYKTRNTNAIKPYFDAPNGRTSDRAYPGGGSVGPEPQQTEQSISAHPPRIDESVVTLVPGVTVSADPEEYISPNGQKQKTGKFQRQPKQKTGEKKDGTSSSRTTHKGADKKVDNSDPNTRNAPDSNSPLLVVNHYGNTRSTYPFRSLLEGVQNNISPDLLTIIIGNEPTGIPSSANLFLRELVSESKSNVNLQLGGRENNIITSAVRKNTPQRAPSVRRQTGNRTLKRLKSITGTWKKRVNNEPGYFNQPISEFITSMVTLVETLSDTVPWFVICANTSPGQAIANKFDTNFVESQLWRIGLVEIYDSFKSADYGVVYTIDEFLDRYEVLISIQKFDESSGPAGLCEDFALAYNWTRYDMNIGRTSIFLSDRAWRSLESEVAFLRSSLAADNPPVDSRNRHDMSAIVDETASAATGASQYFYDGIMKPEGSGILREEASIVDGSEHDFDSQNTATKNPSIYNIRADRSKDMKSDFIPPSSGAMTEKDTYNISKKPTFSRKLWLCLSYSFTFYCIPPCLEHCLKLRKKESQVAWREKIAFNVLVYLLTIVVLFIIIGFSLVVCPRSNVLTVGEVANKNTDDNPLMYAYGRVFEVERLRSIHERYSAIHSTRSFSSWEGRDVTPLFDLTLNQSTFSRYCPGYELPEDGWLNYDEKSYNSSNSGIIFQHKFLDDDGNQEPMVRPYLDHLIKEYSKYRIAWGKKAIEEKNRTSRAKLDPALVVLHGNVYDLSAYWLKPFFSNNIVEDILRTGANKSTTDIAKLWNTNKDINKEEKDRVIKCMNNLFYRGIIDPREEIKCVITKYVLITVTGVAVGVIGIKYISAFRFFHDRNPEKQEKFVICLIPCYTEGYESLSSSIRSVSLSNYDDRFKLMCIICDGQVTGKDNDKTTVEIVLDVLKNPISQQEIPEALAFKSIGAGALQNNYARVYSGIYEDSGHLVPYIVIAKIGSISERYRPGNRGKRDSHLILMKFLNRVHLNSEMNPLELEMYRLMTDVIGINPLFYEYVLMIDADTVIFPDAMNRLVSRMALDSKIVGLCGETQVENSKQNWITMIQVYEYYISHNISKAFESLFGTVTCLPGCFSMYRIRSLSKNIPFLCSTQVLEDYSENLLDTLHLKNLLTLGEDRYLTTLMIKHFPYHKTSYIQDAKCKTKVPDSFNVLVSQRRRWINSTIHNLIELLRLQQLCGACFFSMRFIVFIDMLSTFVQPAAVIYICYLIYLLITQPDFSVMISVLMIGCIYGIQALLAIMKMQWEYILWLIIHIIVIPYFSFWIPVHSFWNVDDFSWGKTRSSKDVKDKHAILPEDRDFIPNLLPLKNAPNYHNPLVSDKFESVRFSGAVTRSGGEEVSVRNSPYHMSVASLNVRGQDDRHKLQQSMISNYSPFERGYSPSFQMPYSDSSQPAVEHSSYPFNRQSHHSSSVAVSPHHSSGVPFSQSISFRPTTASVIEQQYPTREELTNQIRHIILNNNLMSLTKKRIREELETLYGIDLSGKRQSINQIVDELLHSKSEQFRTGK